MPKPDPDYDVTEGESTFRGVILPLILIAVGLSIRIAFALFSASSASQHIGMMICQLVISLFVLLVGCFIASAMMSLNFGPIDRAILKLCAVSLCAGAVGTILASMGPKTNLGPNMTFVAWHAVVLCYIILFLVFFSESLGMQETVLTVVIVVMMQLAVSFSLARGLGIGDSMALFFSR